MKPTSSMVRTFEGRTVVLTGAASGIGRALANALSRCGATVHALDINADGLADLARESAGPGVIHCGTVDVRDIASYTLAVTEVMRISKSIDYLFNNAGVTLLGEAQNLSFDRWKWLLDINLMGVIYGTHLIYPIMIAQGSGHIINTASIAGATGYATAAAYTTSKAAILEFSRSLRSEAKAYGVKVSVACPGYVDSGIFIQERIVGADREAMIRDLPVKMMSPDEAAMGFLTGVVRGEKTMVFPLSAKLLWYLSRWAPSMTDRFHKRFLRVFQQE
ncbi:MAG: SDR family NAD(P)-dependent oxidoreductase [Luteolibacter sp.]